MADIKFSQFANTPTPNANAYFVGYNSVTGINSRTTLTDLITAIGAPSGTGTANFVTKWSGTNSLGDSLFYSDEYVAKTIYGGVNKGLYIDFDFNESKLSNSNVGVTMFNDVLNIGDISNLGLGTKINIQDAGQIIKTQNGIVDNGLYIDFANNQTRIKNNNLGLDIFNTTLYLGDIDGINNTTIITIDDDSQIIKTATQNADNGLYLDFVNGISKLTNFSGNGFFQQLYETYIGDIDNNIEGTLLYIDVINNIIKTKSGGAVGADKGLFLDFANNQYSFGDYDGAINGTTLTVNDSTQIISLFSQRVQYTGQDSATIAAFTGNTAGQLAYDSDLNSFQYYNGTAWAAVAPKTTYMMTGVFTNMFGGDPGGLNKDILDWVGSSPASSHSSALPILQNCRITAAGFKWISSAPIGTISAGDSWTIQVFKMINPLTASTTADGNFTLVGNLNITLTSANSGTTPGVFSSGLNLTLNAGDIIRIAGVETGTIGTSTEEAQLTVLFELI